MSPANFTLTGNTIDEERQVSIRPTACKKIRLHQHLAPGLDILRNQDSLLDATASDIVEHNQQIEAEASEEIVKRTLISFCEIVDSWKPMFNELSDDFLMKIIAESENTEHNSDTLSETGAIMQTYLTAQISDAGTLELKAEQIGDAIGLNNPRVGLTLWQWSRSDDAPFVVSSIAKQDGVNIWEIEKRG